MSTAATAFWVLITVTVGGDVHHNGPFDSLSECEKVRAELVQQFPKSASDPGSAIETLWRMGHPPRMAETIEESRVATGEIPSPKTFMYASADGSVQQPYTLSRCAGYNVCMDMPISMRVLLDLHAPMKASTFEGSLNAAQYAECKVMTPEEAAARQSHYPLNSDEVDIAVREPAPRTYGTIKLTGDVMALTTPESNVHGSSTQLNPSLPLSSGWLSSGLTAASTRNTTLTLAGTIVQPDGTVWIDWPKVEAAAHQTVNVSSDQITIRIAQMLLAVRDKTWKPMEDRK